MKTTQWAPIALNLAGIAAFVVVLWFGLPLFPGIRGTAWVSPEVRAGLAAALLGGWLLSFGARRWYRRRAGKRFIRYLIQQGDPTARSTRFKAPGWWRRRHHPIDDGSGIQRQHAATPYATTRTAAFGSSEQRLSSIRDHYKSALWSLRTVIDGRGRKRSLRQLPWFLVIGSSGAGKSSFLERAGLPFPVAGMQAQNPIAGCGASRDCRWWFHQDCVAIETAGRFFSMNSIAEDDEGDWRRFLQFLSPAKYAPPIQATLLLVDIRKVIDPRQRPDEVNTLRQRLADLGQHLPARASTYLVLTHVDQLLGFSESFSQASPDYRHDYWGFVPDHDGRTDDEQAQSTAQWVGSYWDDLAHRLERSLPPRLQAEGQLSARLSSYAFPDQLASFKPLLLEFIREVFDDSSSPSTLDGLFLSSATQAPANWDWVSLRIRHQLQLNGNLPRLPPEMPRGYFVRGPIHQVAIPQSEQPRKPSLRGARATWRPAVHTFLILAMLTLVASWVYNSVENQRLMGVLQQRVEQAQTLLERQATEQPSPVQLMPALDALADTAATFPAYAPLPLRTGLYQGTTLRAASLRAYQRAVRTLFMPSLTRTLEQSLRANTAGSAGRQATAALYASLDDPQRLDRQGLQRWFLQRWQQDTELTTPTRQSLERHLKALLRLRLTPQTVDYELLSAPPK